MFILIYQYIRTTGHKQGNPAAFAVLSGTEYAWYTFCMWRVVLKLLLRPIALVVSCILMIAGLSEVPSEFVRSNHKASHAGGQLTIRFLDVGQADAAILIADGEAMLIDGGNVADSSLIVSALRRSGITHLSAVICTHAHEDHVGGLAAALKACSADAVYSPVKTYDSKAFSDFVDYAKRRDCDLMIPKQGDSFHLGSATVRFLSPVPYPENTNDTSLVVRVEHGEHSFLFMADAERGAELQLLDAGMLVPATVLKVGHHGSDSSTSYVFLREVVPEYAVISVEEDNSYGFPDEVVLSRLADAGSTVLRTDLCGEITMQSDGTTLTVSTERGFDKSASMEAGERDQPIPADAAYVGNRNSKKFHKPDCRSLPSEINRVFFSSRASAAESGYVPCGQCRP